MTDVAGNQLAANSGYSFVTEDNTAPTVASLTPASGATGIVDLRTLRIVFSEQVVATGGAVVVSEVDGGKVTASVDVTDTDRVSVSAAGVIVVVLDARATATPNTEYDVTIEAASGAAAAFTDTAGNPLAAQPTWTFTTAADEEPPRTTVLEPFHTTTIPFRSLTSLTIDFTEVVRLPVDAEPGTAALRVTRPGLAAGAALVDVDLVAAAADDDDGVAVSLVGSRLAVTFDSHVDDRPLTKYVPCTVSPLSWRKLRVDVACLTHLRVVVA